MGGNVEGDLELVLMTFPCDVTVKVVLSSEFCRFGADCAAG